MDPSDLLPHRAALIGGAVALVIGLTGGLALKVGAQTAPESDMAFASEPSTSQDEPIAWPSGKVPDYVVGTDFLRPPQPDTPVVVASYEIPEYVPAAWTEPEPQVQPVRLAETGERRWPSTGSDILDTRLPEDAPSPPEPPQAIDAPDAAQAAAPITMAAAN